MLVTDDAVPRELLTTAEVAAVLRVSPATVGRWVREGKLPAVGTPGGRNRFRPEDVTAFSNAKPVRMTDRERGAAVSRLIVDRLVREMDEQAGGRVD